MPHTFDDLPPEICLNIITQIPYSRRNITSFRLLNRYADGIITEHERHIVNSIAASQFPAALRAAQISQQLSVTETDNSTAQITQHLSVSDIGERAIQRPSVPQTDDNSQKELTLASLDMFHRWTTAVDDLVCHVELLLLDRAELRHRISTKYLDVKGWQQSLRTGLHLFCGLTRQYRYIPREDLRRHKKHGTCREFVSSLNGSEAIAIRHTSLILLDMYNLLFSIYYQNRVDVFNLDHRVMFPNRMSRAWMEKTLFKDAMLVMLSLMECRELKYAGRYSQLEHRASLRRSYVIWTLHCHNHVNNVVDGKTWPDTMYGGAEKILNDKISDVLSHWDDFLQKEPSVANNLRNVENPDDSGALRSLVESLVNRATRN